MTMAVVNKVACKSSHDLLAIIYISGNVGGYASSNLGWRNDIFKIGKGNINTAFEAFSI